MQYTFQELAQLGENMTQVAFREFFSTIPGTPERAEGERKLKEARAAYDAAVDTLSQSQKLAYWDWLEYEYRR